MPAEWKPSGAAPGDGDNKPALVEEVKSLCRADPAAKAAWCAWCDQNTGGTKDPNRLDPAALSAFLAGYQDGSLQGVAPPEWKPPRAAPGEADEKPALVEEVKFLCREDLAAKAAWGFWCDQNTGGTKDPNRLDAAAICSFLAAYQDGSIRAPTANGATTPFGAPARPGVPELADLAEAVKVGQRVSPEWKNAWVQFCGSQGDGTMDPSRHTKEFLVSYLEFLGSAAVQLLQSGGGGGPGWGPQAYTPHAQGKGKGKLGKGGLAVPTSASPLGGPPAKRPRTGDVAPAPVWPQHAQSSRAQELIARVKALQKGDPAVNVSWKEFCDEHGKGTYDPTRHTAETLEMFLASMGE